MNSFVDCHNELQSMRQTLISTCACLLSAVGSLDGGDSTSVGIHEATPSNVVFEHELGLLLSDAMIVYLPLEADGTQSWTADLVHDASSMTVVPYQAVRKRLEPASLVNAIPAPHPMVAFGSGDAINGGAHWSSHYIPKPALVLIGDDALEETGGDVNDQLVASNVPWEVLKPELSTDAAVGREFEVSCCPVDDENHAIGHHGSLHGNEATVTGHVISGVKDGVGNQHCGEQFSSQADGSSHDLRHWLMMSIAPGVDQGAVSPCPCTETKVHGWNAKGEALFVITPFPLHVVGQVQDGQVGANVTRLHVTVGSVGFHIFAIWKL